MNTVFPVHFLMSESEADREMEKHFRERAEQEAAERAERRSTAEHRDEGLTSSHAQLRGGCTAEDIDPELQAMFDAIIRGETIPSPVGALHPAKATEVIQEATAVGCGGEACAAETPAGPEYRDETDLGAFPLKSMAELRLSADPLRDLDDLCRQLLVHRDYARVRADYCRLSIQLNELGRLAPAYRSELKAGAPRGNKIHMVVHRDQIVIDLHWCYAKKMAIFPADTEHQALFNTSASFPFELAWELSGKKWRSEYRAAEALALTALQQCQLLKLRGPEVAERARAVHAGWRASGGKSASRMAMVRRLIGQWAERDKRIVAQRGYYEKLWLARELLGPDCSNQLVADLHALMVGGDVQDRTTIRDKLKSLDRQITGV